MAERPLPFPRLLRRFRLAAGLSQEALAERAGLSTRGVSDLERGLHASPRAETVRLLAAALRLGEADRAALTAAAYPEVAAEASASSADASPSVSSRDLHPTPLDLVPLPVPPTRLVGREADVARLCALLRREEVRLVTLTGPGGVGKTRLASAVADELIGEERCTDGVAFVDLAPLRDPDLVASTVAATLGVRDDGGQSPEAALTGLLRKRRLLLVLDNFEHLLPAALLVANLLAACPRLVVLATSRERLHLRGEREVPLAPLALPEAPDPRRPAPLEGLAGVAAVRLFAERAEEASPDFSLDEGTAAEVAEICIRLDGLPLAIELAAAQVKQLPPRELLARLERRLPVLTGGAHDLPPRQRALRDTIAWSYDLLAPESQAIFRRLAVFAGGCTAVAAGAVSSLEEGPERPLALAALIDASLVRREEAEGEPRYRMLETVREFALERLDASGEGDEARRRHLAHYLALSEAAEARLRGPEQATWLRQLEAERANLRTALDWALAHDHAAALRLVAAQYWFWCLHNDLREGSEAAARALATEELPSDIVRVRVLLGAAWLAVNQADLAAVEAHAGAALALAEQIGDAAGAADALDAWAEAASIRGDLDRSAALYETAAARFRTLGDGWRQARSLKGLGGVCMSRGDLDRAAALLEEALGLYRARGDTEAAARTLIGLADLARARGQADQAQTWGEEALAAIEASSRDRFAAGQTRRVLGLVAYDRGDYARFAALVREGLRAASDFGVPDMVALGLADIGIAAEATGRPEPAVRLFGAAAALSEAIEVPLAPDAMDRTRIDRHRASARAALGEEAFAAEWAAGRALPGELAVDQALALVAEIVVAGPASADSLTPERFATHPNVHEQGTIGSSPPAP
jgi:predicted ATPase/transcriptional regulator with XRE-family HTH domain